MAASTDTGQPTPVHQPTPVNQAGREPRPHKKVSVTLPADLLDQIKERVGPGNLSRHLSEVLAEDERQRAMRDWLERMETEHGPIPAEAIEEVRRRWLTAREVL